MHVIVIGWLYVILMAAMTESSLVGSALFFVFYGLAPMFLLNRLFGRSRRRQEDGEAPPDQRAP
jgi:hypothetical protein